MGKYKPGRDTPFSPDAREQIPKSVEATLSTVRPHNISKSIILN